MNKPIKSKINWSGALISIIGLLAVSNVIPREAEEHLTELAMIFTGPAIIAFRTWFTEKKDV